jgi:Flp pilus assembly protein TadD
MQIAAARVLSLAGPLMKSAASLRLFFSGRIPAAAAGLAGFVVFLGTLGHGFVYDDGRQILENPWIWDVRHLPRLLTGAVWSFVDERPSNYYRPVQMLLYFLDARIFGRHPLGFHLTNILVHALASAAAFVLLKRVTGPGRALLAALLFAVHPAHVESVAWIAGSTDVNCALLVFLCLWAWTRAPEGRGWLALSAALFFLALLAKETAAVTPILALAMPPSSGGALPRALDPGRARNAAVSWWRRAAPACFVFAVPLAAYLMLRLGVLGTLRQVARPGLTQAQAAATALALIPRYISVAFLPWRLVPDRVIIPTPGLLDPQALAGAAILAGAVAAVIALRRRSPAVAWGIVLLIVPLAPVLQVQWLGGALQADRYLYVPALGACLLGAEAWGAVWRRMTSPAARRAWLAVGAAVVLVASAWTSRASGIWRDDETLGRAGIALEPRSVAMHLVLVHALDMSGKSAEAYSVAAAARAIDPDDRRVAAAVAGLRARVEARTNEEAIAIYRASLEADPDQPHLWSGLASAYLKERLPEQAVEAAGKALALDRNNVAALVNLGTARGMLGDYAGQERESRRALAIDPGDAAGWMTLGAARLAQDDLEESETALRRATALSPGLARAHLYLSLIASRRDDFAGAIREAEKAAELDPTDTETWNHLGVARARGGDAEGARRAWEKTLALDPGDRAAAQNLKRLADREKTRPPGQPQAAP